MNPETTISPSLTALAEESTARAAGLVRPALRRTVDALDDRIRPIIGYHFGWVDTLGLPSDNSGGKMIRAALTILCGEACGGEPDRLVPGAAAVEFVHNFSLLHDDVMDRDRKRRGRPTVWVRYGVPAAILAGDVLLATACGVIGSVGERGAWAARVLLDAVTELAEGQLADLELETRTNARLEQPLAVAARKTAALLRCSCELGAGLAGAPGAVAERFARFGTHLGMAFQLVDDLLGIWGDPGTTGKPIGSDLRNRKLTVPVAAALRNDGPAAAELARLYANPNHLSDRDVERAAALVEREGGRDWTEREIQRRRRLAIGELDALRLPEEHRAPLVAVADYISLRDR